MKLRKQFVVALLLSLALWHCSDLESPISSDKEIVTIGRFEGLSKETADSTIQIEKLIVEEPDLKNPPANARTLINYASQAVVTAESTLFRK
jgi:hypothetical protein